MAYRGYYGQPPASAKPAGRPMTRGLELAGALAPETPQAELDPVAIRRKAMAEALQENTAPIVTGGSAFDDWGQIATRFGEAFLDAGNRRSEGAREEMARLLKEKREIAAAEREANKPISVAPGASLVRPNTFETVYTAPSREASSPDPLMEVSPGATLYDRTTGRPVYRAPPNPTAADRRGDMPPPPPGFLIDTRR
jgi:hypothetical protein